MSRFENLSNDKIAILMRLLSSKDIVKAVNYSNSNFLEQPDISDPSELIYSKVFPYKFVPTINETKNTYITLSFRGYRPVGTSFKSGIVYINVITHVDLIRTDYGKLRYDFIISEIDKLMNQQRGIGIGKVQFYDADEIIVNEKYIGMYVAYKTYESN